MCRLIFGKPAVYKGFRAVLGGVRALKKTDSGKPEPAFSGGATKEVVCLLENAEHVGDKRMADNIPVCQATDSNIFNRVETAGNIGKTGHTLQQV